jgi:hypothetical protein
MLVCPPTLFIWVSADIANTDSTIGLTPYCKIRDYGLNSLILNNNQYELFFVVWDVIWIGRKYQIDASRLSAWFLIA